MASSDARKNTTDNRNDIVKREQIADGITRITYRDGGSTDICVTNKAGGPMDFQSHLGGGQATE